MTANKDEQQSMETIAAPPMEGVQPETENIHGEQHGVSRRLLLKGAAVMGGSLAAVGGIALTGQQIVTHGASVTSQLQVSSSGKLREYWIQATSFLHNLVPTGQDGLMGMSFKPNQTSYWALGYRAYTPGWGQPLGAMTILAQIRVFPDQCCAGP